MSDVHERHLWLKVVVASERPDSPTNEEIATGIQEGLPKEWFERDRTSHDSDHWIEAGPLLDTPTVVILEHTDESASVLTDEGIEVVEFDDYMVEAPGDYEVEDFENVLAKLDALPEHLRPTHFRERIAQTLKDKREEEEAEANETRWYTVVGIYDSTDMERFADSVEARDPAEAIALIKANLEEGSDDLHVAGVFEGRINTVDAGPTARDDL